MNHLEWSLSCRRDHKALENLSWLLRDYACLHGADALLIAQIVGHWSMRRLFVDSWMYGKIREVRAIVNALT